MRRPWRLPVDDPERLDVIQRRLGASVDIGIAAIIAGVAQFVTSIVAPPYAGLVVAVIVWVIASAVLLRRHRRRVD